MTGIMNLMQMFLGEFLYTLLVHPFFFVINVADNIFRALAGIDNNVELLFSESVEGTVDSDGGVVYDLLKTDLIRKIFIAILVLAVFLLIIFTVMAFLKNVYAQKQKTSKEIISNSLKGLIYFIFVPVCTLLGVYLGNIVLRAVNGATSNGGGSSIVGTLFIAGAYNANQWRKGQELKPEDKTRLKTLAKIYGYENLDAIDKAMTAEEFANVVDDVFASADEKESIYWHPNVAQYYDTWSFNFIIIIVGGCFIVYVMCSLAFAMARRIFIMLIWFVISPACCAMFPLDEGKMVGKYKDEMTKQVLSAYGAVAGINLFLSIMPLIDNIKITGVAGASGFINLFIQICGLLCVKELVSALSSLVGGEDALSKGSSLMKATTGAMKKYGGGLVKKGVSTGTKLYSNFKRYGARGEKGGLFDKKDPRTWKYSGIGGALTMLGGSLTKGLTGIDIESDVVKNFRDTTKAEKEEIKTARAKKVKKEFYGAHAGDINKNMTGEKISNLLTEGQEMGVTLEDLVEKIREDEGMTTVEERAFRARYTEARKAEAQEQSNKAMYGAQTTESITRNVDEAVEKQAVLVNANEAVGSATEAIKQAITNAFAVVDPTSGRPLLAGSENADTIRKIQEAMANNNSADMIKYAGELTADTDNANLNDALYKLQGDVLSGADALTQQASAAADFEGVIEKLKEVLDLTKDRFASTTEKVDEFNAKLNEAEGMTAEELKDIAKTINTIINTGKKSEKKSEE